jgi:hypothetical protein
MRGFLFKAARRVPAPPALAFPGIALVSLGVALILSTGAGLIAAGALLILAAADSRL